MTARERFSDEEWASVAALPGLVVMAACLSDGKVVPSVREITAGAGALAQGAASHPENAVLQELLAHETKPDLGERQAGERRRRVETLVGEITEQAAVLRTKVATEEYAEIAGVLVAVAHAVVGGWARASWARARSRSRRRAGVRRAPHRDPRLTPPRRVLHDLDLRSGTPIRIARPGVSWCGGS